MTSISCYKTTIISRQQKIGNPLYKSCIFLVLVMDKSVFMILHIFILYSLFVFHCSGYKNYCQKGKSECVKNISIRNLVSEDLKIQDSEKCKLKNCFYEGKNQSSVRYVILVINNNNQFIPTFRSIFQENRDQRASNILIIKLRETCHDLIKRVVLSLLLDENSLNSGEIATCSWKFCYINRNIQV